MSTFHFKHFKIEQSASAMKVGTDAMLLGAMASHPDPSRILDVGTGTGVIALMLAQRYTNASIEAVEIEEAAFEEASQNIQESIFRDRVNSCLFNFIEYQSKFKFDLIVSNPPYFLNSLKNTNEHKTLARHADDLRAAEFLTKAVDLLESNGRVQVIIPNDLFSDWDKAGRDCGLYINQITEVKGKPTTKVNRVILTFEPISSERMIDSFVVRNNDNSYGEDYLKLTSEFHDRIPR